MVLYYCYVESVTNDPDAVARGFLHPDNATEIRYLGWRIETEDRIPAIR